MCHSQGERVYTISYMGPFSGRRLTWKLEKRAYAQKNKTLDPNARHRVARF